MLTTTDLMLMKESKNKIAMITAYDYPSALQVSRAGADVILVGDSLGMVVLGYDATTQVTLDDMIHHAKAARRGAPDTYTIVDMPFMSYHASLEDAIKNATRLFQETDAQAIKVEGISDEILLLIEKLAVGGIPVVGHLGLTPQTVNVMGGYKLQGNDRETSEKMLADALKLEAAGAVSIVLECIPKELGKIIAEKLSVPIIGIGAGVDCDGQVLVYHDLLQYGGETFAKFVKNYADFNTDGIEALEKFVHEIKEKQFPELKHTYPISSEDILPK